MQNETTNYKLQQNGDEQSIDIKQLIYICLNHWYLFVICVIVALAIGFVVNRYTKNVYQTSGTVLIKSDQSFDPTALMTNLNTGKSNVENEMAILRSYSLVERTIKKMNMEVTYLEKGRINTFELYKTAPFDVDFDRSVPQTVGLVYEVSIQKDGKIILHGISDNLVRYDYILGQTVESIPSKIDITSECKQGEWLDNGYNRIRIVFNDKYKAETDNSRKMYFRLNSYASLVKQMMRYSVNTTSKQSSVAAIVMSGNNPRKIVEFTNTLMNEYVMRGLEQKNQVSDNTILFIDSELTGIEESLATAASELKEFRTQNDLMNLDQQSSQIYSKIQALEREKAEMTVNVKIYKRLQDYIKEQIDDPENLAAPSTMGITDPLLNRLVTELVTLSQTKATQLLTQTEQHPQIVKLDEQIVTTKRTLLETINNLVSNAELSLEEINKRIGKATSESKVLPEKQQQLINYQRNFNFNDDTYKYLMQRRAEAQILKASNTPDNEILDNIISKYIVTNSSEVIRKNNGKYIREASEEFRFPTVQTALCCYYVLTNDVKSKNYSKSTKKMAMDLDLNSPETSKIVKDIVENTRDSNLRNVIDYRVFPVSFASYVCELVFKYYTDVLDSEIEGEFFGEESEKFELDVTDFRLERTFEKGFGFVSYTTYLYSFRYKDYLFKWFSSNEIESSGNVHIKGTVKSHQEYKKHRETIVTRCKVLDSV